MEEIDLTIDEDTVFLNSPSSNNSSNELIYTYETKHETHYESKCDTNRATYRTSKKSVIPKRRHTTTCCCL